MSKRPKTNEIDQSQNKSKDEKIIELRSKLDLLKQKSKDFHSLNLRYKQLLSDYSLMNEAKLRLEYEIRQRESEYNRRISDLKAENETLKLGLNDKMTNSKKIYSENDIIEREIALKDEEIKNLNNRLSDLSYQYDKYYNNNHGLIDLSQKLHDDILEQNNQICKLKEDNLCLTKICQENENFLRCGENDIHKLSNQINENDYDLQNLNKKVILQENSMNNMKNKLDSCNNMNIGLQNNIKNMEKEFDDYRNENNMLKNELLNERTIRIDLENNNEKLKNILMIKNTQLNRINNDNQNMKLINSQCNKTKDCNQIQNDKLKKQVIILENQNNILINEIENILDEDRRKKEIINRKGRITSLLRNNNDTLERSINDLDKLTCNYGYDYDNQTSSPRFTYHYYGH